MLNCIKYLHLKRSNSPTAVKKHVWASRLHAFKKITILFPKIFASFPHGPVRKSAAFQVNKICKRQIWSYLAKTSERYKWPLSQQPLIGSLVAYRETRQ